MKYIGFLNLVLWVLFLPSIISGQTETAIHSLLLKESNLEAVSQIEWKATSSHTDQTTGITHIYTRQTMNGQPIIGTESSFHFDNSKSKANFSNVQFREQSKLTMSSQVVAVSEMSKSDLLLEIAQHLEIPSHKLNIQIIEEDNVNRKAVLHADNIAEGDIPFEGVLYFDDNGELKYAYSVQINVKNSTDWWEVIINSMTGEIIDKANYTISCAPTSFENYSRAAREKDHNHSHCSDHGHSFGSQNLKAAATAQECYLVYPYPMESPYNGPQVMSNDPADTIASPYGWHDTNGAIGAEYTITRGNNVWAKEDQNGDNEGTIGFSPDGGANLVFNFPVNDNNDPSTFVAGAVTNLFYWNNLVHDVMHYYGFDEASGNFQETNYSGQGQGGDYVNADAQDSGNCNANFSTPPDGSNPRMQMYTCNNSNPSHDSDLDNGVIVHEYGHGISIRLTGGAGNSFCLQNDEQMGEGWSDYFALMFTIEPGDLGTDSRGIGNYLIGAPINGDGIRPYPYSTDLSINPQTYDHIKTVSVPHGVGSVWCTMLWEMTWGLIEQYGYDPDIYQGNGGNNLALRLVTEALKLQPCSPGFVDGRDAILRADTLLNGGVNSCIIWNAFAKRGLGVSADQGSNFDEDDGTEAFDTPIGTPANCLDNSDFFVVVSDTDVKSCDTFSYNLYFYTNSGETQKVGFALEGLQDTVETIFSIDSVDVPGDLVLQLIDTIGLPAFTSLQFSVLASNGSETDTVDLVLTKFGSPSSVTLLSPNLDTIISDRPVYIDWEPESESQSYQLQIASDSSFTSKYLDTIVSDTDFDYISLAGIDHQYWRVRGLSDCYNGPYSDIWSFRNQICGTTFLDPGGESNYPHNIDTVYVICPDTDSASVILDFIEFSIFENSLSCQFDVIEFYHGDQIDQNKHIGTFCQDDIGILPNQGDLFSTDQTGCLTVRFKSSSVNSSSGWKANIQCVECPPIALEDIVITEESCENASDGAINISVVDMNLDYTFQLVDGNDTTSNTSGGFSGLDAKSYELIVFPTHFPQCADQFISTISLPVRDVANLEIIDGCAFDTSSQVSLTFNCGLNNLHSYILPDSLTSETHEYENLIKGTYQIIVEDTINDLILFDSTILINPMEIDTVEWDTVRMHASETHLYAGFISSCPGVGELDVYQNSDRIAITDLDTSESVINVNSSILPNFMEVQFTITHTWTSDLNIFLKSPSGTLHPLFTSPSNCSQDNINVTVTDTASLNHLDYAVTCDISNTGNGNPGPPYAKTGQFKGQTALNDLMATGISGAWTLVVVDRFNFDQGYIEEFSVHFTYNRATEWYTDPNGQNLIITGDTINPFSSVLTPGVSDTVQIYESCVFQGCNSKPIPITFMIYDDVVELLDNMDDCNINQLTIDNTTISNFPNGTQVQVNEVIHSSAVIDNTMNFIFSAGNSLEFTQGFEIQLGGALEADVKPCEAP